MRTRTERTVFVAALVLALTTVPSARGAATPEQAAIIKEKIQTLRSECAQSRNQITLTLEELSRMLSQGVELRPQFEKYKAELVTMEERAKIARERATSMKQKGEAFFAEAEQQVNSIQNEDIRKEASKRLAKRKKSYNKILSAMQEAKEQLVPFMSDLNDIKTLFDSELSATSVKSSKSLIRKANWHGNDVRESLVDVEQELDRVTAELGTYQ